MLRGALARDLEVLHHRWLPLNDLRYLLFANVVCIVSAVFNVGYASISRLDGLVTAHDYILGQVLARLRVRLARALKLYDLVRLRLDVRLVPVVLRSREPSVVLPDFLLHLLLDGVELPLLLAIVLRICLLVGLRFNPILRRGLHARVGGELAHVGLLGRGGRLVIFADSAVRFGLRVGAALVEGLRDR